VSGTSRSCSERAQPASALASEASFVDVDVGGRSIGIEYAWIAPSMPSATARERRAPLVVFLHEGLGSVSMWKDYPQRLCDAGGYRGLVFSRPGYGRSTPRAPAERWPVDFMQRQAEHLLPRLFAQLGVGEDADAPWLFGHSDGASIALAHAAMFPGSVAGVVAVAPHIVVEDLTLRSIAAARDAYRNTDLRARLARYHDDPDSAFWGWNDVWLDPAFRRFSIVGMLGRLRCPILAAQGKDDEYGTLAQITGIRAHAPQTEILALERCGHSPHRDQPQALTRAVTDFIARHAMDAPIRRGVS
jgi:pimeloyl-ACP methyl ester carboxylesterase